MMSFAELKQLAYCISISMRGADRLVAAGTGGTNSARYCYSIWLRHLVMAGKNGLNTNPDAVAELGPGDSLGIGLAALISGCRKYFALDVVEFADAAKNAAIFEELVQLFRRRTPIPGKDEFPEAKPYLDTYDFPLGILDESRLAHAMEESRLESIRRSIRSPGDKESVIQYRVPWQAESVIGKGEVDMLYSQAVLEHIDDLKGAYKAMRLWLKDDAFMSHQIDFKCHGTAAEWNGHWRYPDFIWRLVRGSRPYLLNRAPHSQHIAILKEEGFRMVCDQPVTTASGYGVHELASRFRTISSDDLVTSGAFIQAVKDPDLSCEGAALMVKDRNP